MKNKLLIVVVVLLVLAIGAGIGVFLSKGEKEKGPGSVYGPEAKKEGARLEKESFSINMPEGWSEMGAPTGISAMVVNASEEITDSAAQKINFRTYFSVVFDKLNEKSKEEYVQYAKNALSQNVPGIIISHEEKGKIDNKDAYFIETELNQRDADFKVLIAIITGEQDIWAISFNTVVSNWEKYKDLFYQTARSFKMH